MAISQDTPIFENSNPKDRRAYREANKESIQEYNKAYRESHKENSKAYYEANKEKIKENVKAYREANKEKIKENKKEYYEANKEKIKDYKKAYLEDNKEKIKEKKKESNKAYRESHKEKVKDINKAYREANKENINICTRNRRARKRRASGTHTAADIQQLLTLQRKKCAVCRTSITNGYHVDHVIPLAMNGSNDKYNLQLLCAPCNLNKHSKHPVNFMQERGFLL